MEEGFPLHANFALQIEAMACYQALEWVTRHEYNNVLIKTNSALLIRGL